MAMIPTIPYKSLALRDRLCFKPVHRADGSYVLRCRWWYAVYWGIKIAKQSIMEVKENENDD